MAIIKPRNRTVIFRLTQDEYKYLETACSIGGGRSLSDFARSKLLASVPAPLEQSPAQPSLSQVEEKLDELKSAVQQLALMIVKP